MKASHRILILAVFIACFLVPCLAGQGQERTGVCPKPYIKTIFPWVGKPGDMVTIHGERFGMPRGEVLFAEGITSPLGLVFAPHAKAEIINWTFHRIWVIVPKSAKSGPIFVRVHCGAESNKVDFTVNKK